MFHGKRWLPLLAAAGFLLSAPVAGWGEVTITYGDSNRPVLFEGVQYGNKIYSVSVGWNTSYTLAYVARTPLFWSDEDGATAGRALLSQALVDDGYTTSATQSYLALPYDFLDPNVFCLTVSLHHGPDVLTNVSIPWDQFVGEIGFTRWDVTVPVESTSWSRIKAIYP